MRAILVGYRSIVIYLARKYISKGYRVTIIDKNIEECKWLASQVKADIINGDATDPKILAKAEGPSGDVIVAATSKDHINIACCLAAKHFFGIKRTMIVLNNPESYDAIRNLGFTHVFNNAELMFNELEKTDETDYLHAISSYSGAQLIFYEIIIKDSMPADGVEVIALGLPKNVVIVSIVRNGKIEFPGRDFILRAKDRIIMAANPETLSTAIHLICGENY